MNHDPASLDRLHDIVTPPPVPLWPPAPGWVWLLAMASVLGLVLLLRGIVRWQHNRYRREALAGLARLEAAARKAGRPDEALPQMAELLKRAALTAYPRAQVAALTGGEWFAFLDRTGGTRFGNGLGEALEQSNYHSDAATWEASRVRELAAEMRAWIRHHRAQPGAAP